MISLYFTIDLLLLEMEVVALRETQERILVMLAAVEQAVKDGQELKTVDSLLSPSPPQTAGDRIRSRDHTFAFDDPLQTSYNSNSFSL